MYLKCKPSFLGNLSVQPVCHRQWFSNIIDCDCLQPEKQGKSASLTAQLLLLYYLLHYEDVRMNNLQVVDRDKIKSYSTEFLSELPIKYLLQQAQRNQQSFAGELVLIELLFHMFGNR